MSLMHTHPGENTKGLHCAGLFSWSEDYFTATYYFCTTSGVVPGWLAAFSMWAKSLRPFGA
ncbi:hypothetical protein SAMN05216197_104126 [Pseudomonas graminis]|uniref:Uncharacterized protein n=1 Tax=Pseudomonas graminis TaxID=158627 RepID=A0A1I0AQX9_9PSED|nr:hypothetical protein SAMN05216197_104126 [Pseudomonas graminis]